ncbi:uncharacterized protein LOC114341841 [Diabrotica virgifera virgifera]|uniref:Uncharacterized protein LOC114341841 n=1 Tax=Diabrotica virgifera virgifera TaxID=50390 RepID=A0A6P7GT03_DIAVI|nr:uncharacterized protein LOC114341841 [Diabrotica virgifera virgifera]
MIYCCYLTSVKNLNFVYNSFLFLSFIIYVVKTMESILEPVVTVPEPTQFQNPVGKYIYSPTVPEVSMISNTRTTVDNFSSQENIWKMKQRGMENPVNMPIRYQQSLIPFGYKHLQAEFAKKQVRFESPVSQQTHGESQKYLSKNVDFCSVEAGCSYQNFSAIRKQNREVGTNPNNFEQMYMANIPDRKLDLLSIIDIPQVANNINDINIGDTVPSNKDLKEKQSENVQRTNVQGTETVKQNSDTNTQDKTSENKENVIPKSYQQYLELQNKIASKRKIHNDSVTDIFNYKKNIATQKQNSPPSYQQNVGQISNNNSDSRLQEKYDKVFDTGFQQKCQTYQPSVQPQTKQYTSGYNTLVQTLLPYQPSHVPPLSQKCDMETQTNCEDVSDSKALENRRNGELNNSDLLKIIAQQNEQLLILQKQVAMLLARDRNYSKPIEASSDQDKKIADSQKYGHISTPQKNHFRQENTITQQASMYQDNQRKWGTSKFSINLTTSFDMPIRGQPKQNFINNEPKIQELTESDLSTKNDNDLLQSIHFQEPLMVREECPSPLPSININMDDYESSDDESSSTEMGTTLYNNLMGQVNNILKRAHIQTNDFRQKAPEGEKIRNKTLNKVKEATLKHLKSLGVTIDDECDLESMSNRSPSDMSLTGKQLLNKYLPSDRVRNEPCGAILEPRPEFSLASLEYMRKYNLISKEKMPEMTQSPKGQQREYWT